MNQLRPGWRFLLVAFLTARGAAEAESAGVAAVAWTPPAPVVGVHARVTISAPHGAMASLCTLAIAAPNGQESIIRVPRASGRAAWTGFVRLTTSGSHTVSVVIEQTDGSLRRLDGGRVRAIDPPPGDRWAAFAVPGARGVCLVNGRTGIPLGWLAPDSVLTAMDVEEASHRLWLAVAQGSAGELLGFSSPWRAPVVRLPAPCPADSLRVIDGLAWATDDHSLMIGDLSNPGSWTERKLGCGPRCCGLTADGRLLVVNTDPGQEDDIDTVSWVDVERREEVARYPVIDSPTGLQVLPGDRAAVFSSTRPRIDLLDTAAVTLSGQLTLPAPVTSAATDGEHLLAAAPARRCLLLIDVAARRVVAQPPMPDAVDRLVPLSSSPPQFIGLARGRAAAYLLAADGHLLDTWRLPSPAATVRVWSMPASHRDSSEETTRDVS